MSLPLNPNENIYVDHQIKDGKYSMPTMQAGDASISKSHVYHHNCSMSDVPYDWYVPKVRIEAFQPIIDLIGE